MKAPLIVNIGLAFWLYVEQMVEYLQLWECQLYKLIQLKRNIAISDLEENETHADISSDVKCLMLYFGGKMFCR